MCGGGDNMEHQKHDAACSHLERQGRWKQRIPASMWFLLSVNLGPQPMGWHQLCWGFVFLPQLNICGNPPPLKNTNTSYIFYVITNLVKLVMRTGHHNRYWYPITPSILWWIQQCTKTFNHDNKMPRIHSHLAVSKRLLSLCSNNNYGRPII